MIKYASFIDEEKGLCAVGIGDDIKTYIEMGMTKMDVEQSDIDNCWYVSEKCPHKTPEEKEREERERVNNLRMTALDFIGVLQGFGLTLPQINEYLEENLSVKMQLTYCQNVYCGVAKSLMPITVAGITITPEMVENAFKERGNYGDN